MFSPIFVADTNTIFVFNFVVPLLNANKADVSKIFKKDPYLYVQCTFRISH